MKNAGQMVLFDSDVTPNGAGGFTVTPRRPVTGAAEVGTLKAARLCGYRSRSSWHEYIINHPKAHLIEWRYTPGGGKVLVNVESLERFKEAIADGGK